MGRYKTKLQSIQEANKRILEQEWYDEIDKYGFNKDGELEELMTEEEFVIKFYDLMQLFNDIQNNVGVIDKGTQREIEMDMKSLDHKLKVLWARIKNLNLPKD